MNKENKKLFIVGVIIVCVAIAAIGFWCRQFWTQDLSSSTADWAAFGSFVGGIVGPALSLLTILYLVWSFSEQKKMLNEQMDKDREKDERDMLLNEIRHYLELMEEYAHERIPLASIAQELIEALGGSSNEYDMVDTYTLKINEEYFSMSAFELLSELEGVCGSSAVKDFIEKNADKAAVYPIKRYAADVMDLVPMLIEARRKDVNIMVLKSMISRIDSIAWILNRWGELDDQYLLMLGSLKMLPINVGNLSEEFGKAYLDELRLAQGVNWKNNEVSCIPKIIKEGSVAIRLTNIVNEECWEKLPVKKWKKVS